MTADRRPPTADRRPPTADHRPPTAVITLIMTLAMAGCDKPIPAVPEPAELRDAPPSNRQSVDLPNDVDLGLIGLGQVAGCKFVIRNLTNEAFTLTGISKSCGCEATNVTEGTRTEAGDSLTISYSLSKYGTGPQSGRLTVMTDSKHKSHQVFEFKLKATYPKRIWSQPEQINLTRDQAGQTSVCELAVYATEPELLDKFFESITSRGLVTVTRTGKTDKSLTFHIAVADDAQASNTDDFVSLLFTDILGTRLDVRVRLRESH